MNILLRKSYKIFIKYAPVGDFLESVAENGLDALRAAFRLLLNAAMLLERQKHLQARPRERTEQRQGHANGFKDKTLATRMGAITVAMPQAREGGFYPSALETCWKRGATARSVSSGMCIWTPAINRSGV